MARTDLERTSPGDEHSLSLYQPSPGCAAWRSTERDAPGLVALITDRSEKQVPADPETDTIVITVRFEGVPAVLHRLEIHGRVGLNSWYLQTVGFAPDTEPDGPRSIMQLIENVACHLMLDQSAKIDCMGE